MASHATHHHEGWDQHVSCNNRTVITCGDLDCFYCITSMANTVLMTLASNKSALILRTLQMFLFCSTAHTAYLTEGAVTRNESVNG